MLIAEQAVASFSLLVAFITLIYAASATFVQPQWKLVNIHVMGLLALVACDIVWMLRLFG